MPLHLDRFEFSKGNGIDATPEVMMIVEISSYMRRVEGYQFSIFTQKFHTSVSKTIRQYNGSILKNDNNCYLVAFESVSDAVLCALKIQYKFKYVTPKHESFQRRLNIALTAGASLGSGEALFEDAIELATHMCEVVVGELVISAAVAALYETENKNAIIDKELIRALIPSEEKFLTQIMDHIETNWNEPTFNVANFSTALGYSDSQLYRRMIQLTGKPPSNFIREFRLHMALLQLHQQEGTISDIAQKSGFKSPSHFSKCFQHKYGVLPSKYVQQHIS